MKGRKSLRFVILLLSAAPLYASGRAEPAATPLHNVVIRGGMIIDGSGSRPFVGSVIIDGDRIGAVERGASQARGRTEIDARGLAVAPGFINMLSWANESLLLDGRAMSDLKQGVTLEVMGEGDSMGPLTPVMQRLRTQREGDFQYPIKWTTLAGYLEQLEAQGISPNVASFVGAATVRINELGETNVDPTPAQLTHMRALVRQAMQEGAMGVASALIYAPGTYAKTPELVALARESGLCGGMYISHLRSEGDRLLPALDELITISRESGAPAEIYHFKQAGRDNWGKYDAAVNRIESARAQGLRITADMYMYTAGATGLDAAMPPWVQDGGFEAWQARLRDPAIRAKVAVAMDAPGMGWENLFHAAGGAENMILIGFKNPALKHYTGMTLAAVSASRHESPEQTAMDLVVEDGSRVSTAYFLMSEDNVRREVQLPWMSFGSDEAAPAAEGIFLKSQNHPRAYGNFARVLGRYVREEKLLTLPAAIARLSTLPAHNLGLHDRGAIVPGYYADLAIFDPKTIADRATFAQPAQYAEGMRDVVVNGRLVLRDGVATGAKPGRFVRGPGWTGWPGGGACKPSSALRSAS